MTLTAKKVDTCILTGSTTSAFEKNQIKIGHTKVANTLARWADRFWSYTETMEDHNIESFKGLL